MEPYIYILLGFTIGILVSIAYDEYQEYQRRKMLKKAWDETVTQMSTLMDRVRLEINLHEALEREDYERAARIRDLMKKG